MFLIPELKRKNVKQAEGFLEQMAKLGRESGGISITDITMKMKEIELIAINLNRETVSSLCSVTKTNAYLEKI